MATATESIIWLLEELKVPYELKLYKRGSDKLADPKLKEVHPLGKSPVITVETPNSAETLILAESGAIVEFLCEHFGQWMIPKHYQDGKQGQVGGETESWLRYRYLMHYAEGIKEAPVPFFIKPVTKAIANRISSFLLEPNFRTSYDFLESQLATAPDKGEFFCGTELSGADILMIFPFEAGQSRTGFSKGSYPKIWAYVDRIHQREAYRRATDKIKSSGGDFKISL
ncbi:MAG: hypothetical protein Q9227_003961 [Pyrenula ochraceoflavens]